MIVGMDWLTEFKAEIVCREKIVWIPLPNGEILNVHGERPEENSRHLMSTKMDERRLEDIPIVRDFTEDLSGLPYPR